MSDPTPALLVPVDVSAMVVSGRSRNFRRWPMVYENLARGATPETAPFEFVQDDFADRAENQGVYVAWTLPEALRRGRQDPATGAVVFPAVPNRWLVVRMHGDPAARQAAAWVVESDYVWPAGARPDGTPEGDPGRSARFLDAASDPAAPRPARLGRKLPVGAGGWTEPGGAAGRLTAVAPGNVSFAAFQPHNPNVFSLHDELALRGVPAGMLSYYVVGWYSRPGDDDPLAGWDAARGADALAARLHELGWTLAPEMLAVRPRRSLYHGMSAAVRWEPGADLAPALPGPGAVRLAVGNTSVDALTALVEAQVREAGSPPGVTARLLEAFQYDLLAVLDQPGGDLQLERAIRDAWFGSRPAGTRWEVASADPPAGEAPAPPPPAAQLAAEAALLAPLNAAQSALDAALQRLGSLQARLYEIWWKSVAAREYARVNAGRYPWGTTPQQFAAALADAGAASLPARVSETMGEVNRLRGDVDRAAEATRHGTGGVPPLARGRVLKEVAEPRFWMAGDPVVVVAGAKQSGTLRPRAVRACRVMDQLADGLWIDEAEGSDVPAEAAPLPPVALGGLPPEMGALLREFALLDPVNARALARLALGGDDDARVEAVRAAILAPRATAGVLPDHDLGEWSPPWLPLFLEWEVRWYPIPFAKGDAPLWSYDGTDYARAGADVAQPEPMVVSGRAILTPKPSFDFRARLKQFAAQGDGADARALDAFIERTSCWDFLSQTLTGLHDQLALRNPRANLAPDDRTAVGALGMTLAALVGGGRHSVPRSLKDRATRFAADAASSFEGLRAGQFVFTRVAVVDRFGQTVEVVTNTLAPTFVPVRAPGLTPARPVVSAAAGTPVQLPPRLLQPARLTFDFLAPDDVPAWDAASNPLCGWFVPNHLDRALAVYEAGGGILGELRPAAGPGGIPYAAWDPAPGTGAPATLNALRAAYPHLGEAVAGLAAAGADELARFLEAVDETLWSVDGVGDRSGLLLNALVGRPLAVVRAAVGVQLQGDPVSDPSWPFTFAPKRAPFTGYPIEVELGDAEYRRDGLMGYWADGYGRFNTVHPLPGAPADGYLRPIGAGNRLRASVDGGPARATLLLDPRGSVSARCGLLPSREITLPARFVDGPVQAMHATFRAGPVLTVLRPPVSVPAPVDGAPAPDPDATPRALPYPVPAGSGGWEWIELRTDGTPLVRPLVPADARAELLELPASLREGYLRFAPAPPPAPPAPVTPG